MKRMAIAALLVLSGCVENNHPGVRPLRPLELATAPYVGLINSTMTGSLMYEGGCLLFRDDASRALLLPIWPSGSVFNGTSVIFHEPGKASQPILIAQQVQLSGRILPWSELPGYGPFQGQCHSEPFIVTKVRPAD